MEQNGRLEMLGISGAAGTVGLLYDPYSQLLVAHVRKIVRENCPLKSLYARYPNEEHYRFFTPISEILSYEDVVLSPSGPFMFVNIFEAIVDDDPHAAFNWHSLQKIDLPSGKIILELKDGELEPRFGHRSPWVSDIVGVDKDGETIFVRLSIPQEKENKLRYCLAKLDPTQKRYELITELSGCYL